MRSKIESFYCICSKTSLEKGSKQPMQSVFLELICSHVFTIQYQLLQPPTMLKIAEKKLTVIKEMC